MSKKILSFALLILLCILSVVSCDMNKEPKIVQPVNPPQEEGQEPVIVDTVTKNIDFALQKTQTHFYINNNNATQTISVLFFDDDGNRLTQSKVSWDHNLPQGTTIVSSDNSFTFNINSVGVLGDYKITASVKGNDAIKKSYNFSLISANLLENSLSYSYVSDIETIQDIETSQITGIKSCKEYNEAGAKITSESARMVLNETLDYRTNGSNMLLVTASEGSDFGLLTAKSDDENALLAMPVGNNQFLLLADGVSEKTVKLTVNAGTKDTRTVDINLEPSVSYEITAPNINTPYKAQGDGVCIDITGDNISTDYYQFEEGNTLVINVYRKPYDNSEDYSEYPYLMNSECKAIKFGHTLHLEHCGHYRVEAYICDPVGYKSATTVKEFSVQPYTAPPEENITLTKNTPLEKIYTNNLWESYPDGTYPVKSDYYTLQINNPSDTLTYYVNITYKNDEPEKEDYSLNKTVKPLTVVTDQFTDGGEYTVTVYQGDTSIGYGYPMESDVVQTEKFVKTFKIDGYSYYNNKPAVSISTENDTEIHIKPGFELSDDETVYVATYIDNELSESFKLTKDSEDRIYNNNNYRIYTYKAYVFSTEPRVPSVIAIYKAPTTAFCAFATISSEEREVENGRVNRITILNNQNSKAEYRKLSYAITKDDSTVPAAWTALGRDSEYTLEKKTQGTEYYWAKLEPFNEQADGFTTICKKIDLDLTISAEPELIVTSEGALKKAVIINNTKDNGGHYRRIFYAWSTSKTEEPQDWVLLGNEATYTKYKTTEGIEYLWVKTQPTDFENLIGYSSCYTGVFLQYPEFDECATISESFEPERERKAVTIHNLKGSNGSYRKLYYAWTDSDTQEPLNWTYINNPESYTVYKEINGTQYIWVKMVANDAEDYPVGSYSKVCKAISLSVELSQEPEIEVSKASDTTKIKITNTKDNNGINRTLFYAFTVKPGLEPSTWTKLGNNTTYTVENQVTECYIWVKTEANNNEKYAGTSVVTGPVDCCLAPVFNVFATVTTEEREVSLGRIVRINVLNNQNEKGEYRTLSFAVTSDGENVPSAWTILGRESEYTLEKKTHGTQYYWIKLEPYNELSDGFTTVCKKVDLDLNITAVPELIVKTESAVRKSVTINNTKDNSGHFRRIFYAWSSSKQNEPTEWSLLGNEEKFIKYKDTEGIEYLWVKTQPTEFENLIGSTTCYTGVSLNYPLFDETPTLTEAMDAESARKAVIITNKKGSDGSYRKLYYAWSLSKTVEPEDWNYIGNSESYTVYKENNGTEFIWVKMVVNPSEDYTPGSYSTVNKSISLTVDLPTEVPITVKKGSEVTKITISNVKDNLGNNRTLYYSFANSNTSVIPSAWTILGSDSSYNVESTTPEHYIWVKMVANDNEKYSGTFSVTGPVDCCLAPAFNVYPTITNEIREVESGRVNRITIHNTQNLNGEYRILSYAVTSDSQNEPSSWTKLGQNESYTLDKKTEGTQYYWIKMEPYNELFDGYTTLCKQVDLDLKLTSIPDLFVSSAGNMKKSIKIVNTKDNGGHYRRVFFGWSSSKTTEPVTWTLLGNEKEYTKYKETEGTEYFWVKTQPTDFENMTGYTTTNVSVNLSFPKFEETATLSETMDSSEERKAITIYNKKGSDNAYRRLYYGWSSSTTKEPDSWTFISNPVSHIVYKENNGTEVLWVKMLPNDLEEYPSGSYSLTNKSISLNVTLSKYPTISVVKSTTVTKITITNVKDNKEHYRKLYYAFADTTGGSPTSWITLGNDASYYVENTAKTKYIWVKMEANSDEKYSGTYSVKGPVDCCLTPVMLSSYAAGPSISSGDSIQTNYNKREAIIYSTQDSNGTFRPIRYKLGGGAWSDWFTPTKDGKRIQSNLIAAGSETLSVEMKATSNEVGEGTMTASATLTLSQVKRPRVHVHVNSGLSGRIYTEYKCTVEGNPGAIAYADMKGSDESASKTGNTSKNAYVRLHDWQGWLISNNNRHQINAYQRQYGYLDSATASVNDGKSNSVDNYAGDE